MRLVMAPMCVDRQRVAEVFATRHRRAFTLLELVVVLAIIVVLAGLTWPSMLRYIREQEIREQAHAVRMALAGSRVKAIDTGLTYQFRYEPGGRRYIVLPYDLPESAATGSVGTGDNSAAQRGISSAVVEAVLPTLTGQLPESCHFDWPLARNVVTNAEQQVATESLPQEWLSLFPDATQLQSTAWSQPILFYSDGTTDDNHLTILNELDRSIELSLRGLTGATTVGPLK
ncbi:MAG: prepilin-type N-terminal cleavage/methylation domain-containing protein [Planctomycetaceae bacterium]